MQWRRECEVKWRIGSSGGECEVRRNVGVRRIAGSGGGYKGRSCFM